MKDILEHRLQVVLKGDATAFLLTCMSRHLVPEPSLLCTVSYPRSCSGVMPGSGRRLPGRFLEERGWTLTQDQVVEARLGMLGFQWACLGLKPLALRGLALGLCFH